MKITSTHYGASILSHRVWLSVCGGLFAVSALVAWGWQTGLGYVSYSDRAVYTNQVALVPYRGGDFFYNYYGFTDADTYLDLRWLCVPLPDARDFTTNGTFGGFPAPTTNISLVQQAILLTNDGAGNWGEWWVDNPTYWSQAFTDGRVEVRGPNDYYQLSAIGVNWPTGQLVTGINGYLVRTNFESYCYLGHTTHRLKKGEIYDLTANVAVRVYINRTFYTYPTATQYFYTNDYSITRYDVVTLQEDAGWSNSRGQISQFDWGVNNNGGYRSAPILITTNVIYDTIPFSNYINSLNASN